jgi:hypothetical protein
VGAVLAHGFLSGRDASTVNQAHQFPQAEGLCYDGLAVCFVADVAPDKCASDFPRHGLAFVDLHVSNHHQSAMSR